MSDLSGFGARRNFSAIGRAPTTSPASYEDRRASQLVSEHADIPAVTLPFTIGGTPAATNLFALYDDTITRLLAGLGQ